MPVTGRQAVRWGQLKRWADDNKIGEDHVVLVQTGRYDNKLALDMSETETDAGEPALLVQFIYG